VRPIPPTSTMGVLVLTSDAMGRILRRRKLLVWRSMAA
jgi:hypothetical protein